MLKSKKNKSYKIVVTGGTGRFGKILKKINTNHKMIFPAKKTLNITNTNSIEKFLLSAKSIRILLDSQGETTGYGSVNNIYGNIYAHFCVTIC